MINTTNVSKRMMQCCLMLMLFLAQSAALFAQAELSMENFTIASGETKEVALLLENDEAVTALQVSINLPKGLKYVDGSIAKTSRVSGRGAMVQASDKTGKLVIVETDGTINPGEGAIITFSLTAGTLEGSTEKISFENVVITNVNNENISGHEYNDVIEGVCDVKLMGLNCKFSAPESIEIADTEYQVDITLSNEIVDNHYLTAIQGTLTLPKGLEIVEVDVEGESSKFIYSDRIPRQSAFEFKEDAKGNINFVLSSGLSNAPIVGNDGVLFSFIVKADENLDIESEIKLTNLYAAIETGKSQLCDDVTISVFNVSVLWNMLQKQLEEVKAQLDDALVAAEGYEEEIVTNAVLDATDAYNDLRRSLDASLKDGTLRDFDFETEAQPARDAIDNIYTQVLEADKAAFEAYKNELIDAADALAEEGDSEAAQEIIEDAKADIETLEYDEEKTLDENKAAADDILAKAEKALETQRNKDAFEEYKEELSAAADALAEEGDSEASQKIIEDAKADIEALEYDEEKTLDENKAFADDILADAEKALETQRDKDNMEANKAAFEEYKEELSAAADALAEEGDSEASQKIIEDAKAAIEALEYDEEKTLAENKAAADEILAAAKEDLEAQRDADATLPGDVNGDGVVDTVDASYILMHIAGNTPKDFNAKNADVDGDGEITTVDATIILKSIAK